MPRMFDHLGLPVRNIEEARDWFREALGLEIEFEVPEHLWDEVSMKANG